MALLRLVALGVVVAGLSACADVRKPDYLRVSTPCAPNLVSVAVLF
jgi:hypothetical protein